MKYPVLRPIAAALLVAALAAPAAAQTTTTSVPAGWGNPARTWQNWNGGWMFGLRAIGIYPDDSSSIDNLTVGSAWTAELDFSYFFTRNIAVELIAATAKHAVRLNGNEIGKVGVLPPTVTFQWHFSDFGAFKPYVGAGFNYTYFYDRELANNTLTIQRDSWGGAVQVGADYFFAPRWALNFDVKYIWMDTDVRTVNGGVEVGTVDINPVVWGIGVRYLF